jgi:hypothetical protein
MRVWKHKIDRRSFLQLTGVTIGAAALGPTARSLPIERKEEASTDPQTNAVLRVESDGQRARELKMQPSSCSICVRAHIRFRSRP